MITRAMSTNRSGATEAALSETRRKLVETMQQMDFGHIDGLVILDGEPVFDPMPRIVRDIKLGGEDGFRPKSNHADFLLKSQVIELFDHLTAIRTGKIESIEVKHGLPFRLVVEQQPTSNGCRRG
jgi:hypothetical protein